MNKSICPRGRESVHSQVHRSRASPPAPTSPALALAAHDDVTPAEIDRAAAIAKQHNPQLAVPVRPRSGPPAQRNICCSTMRPSALPRARTRVKLLAGRATIEANVPAPLGRGEPA